MSGKHPIWQYGLFQKPALLCLACLVAAVISLFTKFNCYELWTNLFLTLALISFIWMLVLPIDWLLRFQLKLNMSLAGRLAIFQAILYSTAILIFFLSKLPVLMTECATSKNVAIESPLGIISLPFPFQLPTLTLESTTSSTIDPELQNLDWSKWRANVWDEMFFEQSIPAPIDSHAEFKFTVYRDKTIEDVEVRTENSVLEEFVNSRIQSLIATDTLTFPQSSKRDDVLYESEVTVCSQGTPSCGEPADPSQYPDVEVYPVQPSF